MKRNDQHDSRIPQHIAIIMDGNGRWAQARGLDRIAGHEAGAASVKKIVKRCVELEIPYLTLYSFSTENWSRPPSEIDALMDLLVLKLSEEVPELIEQGVRLKHYGNRDKFSPEVLEAIDKACVATSKGTKLTIGLALNYSGRSEIVHAIQSIIDSGCQSERVDDSLVEEHLFTVGVPDPELLIRTAGEMRVSNFLLWQIAYSEIVVTDQCWPDFDGESLDVAIDSYLHRDRTFGNVK